MAKNPQKAWKAWHEVVTIRDDLRKGELPLHMFAADLYEVMMQNGKRPIYEKPEEFFALTFPTHNLRNLVRDVTLRLAGKNDKAVRQLELTYGGGKTHTLITMRQLVHDPASLPDLPAVKEFEQAIGQKPPKARVAALCFDKLDVETGCDVRSPEGNVRRLREPWSILAYQIAGDDGLKLLHAQGKAEERDTPPAENTLTELLELPSKQDLGTLLLIDEVLLYAKVKVRSNPGWLDILTSFFQYLTQAAAKVDRCCIVASLLSSEPKDQADELGKRIVSELYDIFQRQREAVVQPVEQSDVAEVLRRRLFETDSTRKSGDWPQHVIAALKGVQNLDDQTAKEGSAAEERYLKSFPFHPELTEVFYSKWTSIDRFQKTRGVLRTFALALREAANWDESPLIGPAVFLSAPKRAGLSEAARELVAIADTIVTDGQAQRWTGILESELDRAQQVQTESVGLKLREIEQAAIAVFLHSQPTGRSAKTRDLMLLIGPCRPDKIEFEKGLLRWSRNSFWLDDANIPENDAILPNEWRLGNRPNLNQMQAAAASAISLEVVNARLIDEIGKTKSLTSGASASGVKPHTLPTKPRDVDDDGLFHYAVLLPSAASESGKPSSEARKFLDETTGPEKPRVYRNAVLLLCPSKDGLDLAQARIRDYLGWERVSQDLNEKKEDGTLDAARMTMLAVNIDRSKKKIADSIRQAYCIVVTVSEKDEAQAFKITVTDDPHFEIIKNDPRSRVQDMAISADALLPEGPYNLWRDGETSRRIKDLSGAFAQLPHLPKMLKSQAILATLVDGCVQGTFVLRLTRPDRTFRTWWRTRPDSAALNDPAMELVMPVSAELDAIPGDLLAPGVLPGLWNNGEISAEAVADYFNGSTIVQIDKGGFQEPVNIPKASTETVNTAINDAVVAGKLWVISEPASLLEEPIPTGVLSSSSRLLAPPEPISPITILPENLPTAWSDGHTSALAIAAALSNAKGETLPWKTVREVLDGALKARFVKLADGSGSWPCDLPGAGGIKLTVNGIETADADGGGIDAVNRGYIPSAGKLVARAELQPSQLQDLSDAIPQILEIKNKAGKAMSFQVILEFGDDTGIPDAELVQEANEILQRITTELEFK